MKPLNTIWIIIIIILVFAGGQTAYAQEINKAVNSSKALRLLEEIEHTNNEMKIKNEELSKLRKEANELYAQRLRSTDSSEQEKIPKPYIVERGSIKERAYAKRDSLSKRSAMLNLFYANEILRNEDSQAVLDKMRQAMEADNRDSAVIVKEDYIQLLKTTTLEKLNAKRIDAQIYDTEMESIDKIDKALGMLGYLSALVNSPKALVLEEDLNRLAMERRWADWKIASISKRFRETGAELRTLHRTIIESHDAGTLADTRKKLQVEWEMLKKQRDSLRAHLTEPLVKKRDTLYRQYAKEITSGKSAQTVLKQVVQITDSIADVIATLYDEYEENALQGKPTQEIQRKIAEAKRDPIAHDIIRDYIKSLRDETLARRQLYQIDLDISRIETRATDKINTALGYLGIPTFQVVDIIVDR